MQYLPQDTISDGTLCKKLTFWTVFVNAAAMAGW